MHSSRTVITDPINCFMNLMRGQPFHTYTFLTPFYR